MKGVPEQLVAYDGLVTISEPAFSLFDLKLYVFLVHLLLTTGTSSMSSTMI